MMIASSSGIVFFLLLCSLVLHTLAASPRLLHYCRLDQRDALLEFKHEFNHDEFTDPLLSSWNQSSDCCLWSGVTCDARSGEVISLDLVHVLLNNPLKPNSGLFKLQQLKNLTLSDCRLYGEITSSLGNLSRLTHLDLSSNQLTGEVLASISNLNQLRDLLISDNSFSGDIPTSFANFTKLSTLDISNNLFTLENFPFVLPNLTSLSSLNIASNHVKSTLPSDLSRLHNLEYFLMRENSFSGTFPTSLFTIPSLQYVDLEGNQFSGHIKFGNISSSSSLWNIYLANNKFDGPIPESVSKIKSLIALDISNNNLVGTIPTSISKLVNLQHLSLSYNKLQGQVPGFICGLITATLSHNSFNSFGKPSSSSGREGLFELDLGSNSLGGPFPQWICNQRFLKFLDLSNNLFNGSIPPCFKHSTYWLKGLVLRNNSFSGILPDVFVNASMLFSVDVSFNLLEGKLPKSLMNCSVIELVNVGGNRINDTFPSWLASLRSLRVLILRSNAFHGSLYHDHVSNGFQHLRFIDISQNGFSGTLSPLYFSNWREMVTSESSDLGTGEVYMGEEGPEFSHSNSMTMIYKGVETEFLKIPYSFRAIDFSGNRFNGNIPESIGLLIELRLLNLSGNVFTGSIPQALANLTNLETLDVSRNQLSGHIPRDLGSLSFLSTMNFSHNLLEGPVPQGTQFQSQNCSIFMDNFKLSGLEKICGKAHAPNSTPRESEELSEPKEQVINWIAAAIAYGPGVFCGLVIGHIFASHKHKWFRRNKRRVVVIKSAR
ncbi:PREDICTED: receptor like protein 30-like [Camelina sativa]|uniref:Receptor like protein 30-like n=1 Tax=Camelina sativa TaxID=90675 RepID=A0ABM0W0Q0_CAMSA|nr:PREDICTED: receptor like protein 30-like [Camelina sativa]XP_010464058.1 PREDICTED: receptor like protein 30-like [Camelina sativa]